MRFGSYWLRPGAVRPPAEQCRARHCCVDDSGGGPPGPRFQSFNKAMRGIAIGVQGHPSVQGIARGRRHEEFIMKKIATLAVLAPFAALISSGPILAEEIVIMK